MLEGPSRSLGASQTKKRIGIDEHGENVERGIEIPEFLSDFFSDKQKIEENAEVVDENSNIESKITLPLQSQWRFYDF